MRLLARPQSLAMSAGRKSAVLPRACGAGKNGGSGIGHLLHADLVFFSTITLKWLDYYSFVFVMTLSGNSAIII
jgi:hypothetical protein